MIDSQRHSSYVASSAALDGDIFLKPRNEFVLVVILVLVGFFLRVWKITEIPPGLWFDEAINGLDALNILSSGETPIFFQYQIYPREPLYVYLIVPFVWLFGPEPWSIRLASVAAGTITLSIAWLFFREWFDKRTALMALACLVFFTLAHSFQPHGFSYDPFAHFSDAGFLFFACGFAEGPLAGIYTCRNCFCAWFLYLLVFSTCAGCRAGLV